MSNLNKLIKMKDLDGNTAVHLAAKRGRYETVKWFIDHGYDLDTVNNQGWNILHTAAFHSQWYIIYIYIYIYI